MENTEKDFFLEGRGRGRKNEMISLGIVKSSQMFSIWEQGLCWNYL